MYNKVFSPFLLFLFLSLSSLYAGASSKESSSSIWEQFKKWVPESFFEEERVLPKQQHSSHDLALLQEEVQKVGKQLQLLHESHAHPKLQDMVSTLQTISSERCGELLSNLVPYPLYSLPIVDWLSTTNVVTSQQNMLKRTLSDESQFIYFHSLNSVNVWVEPIAFLSRYLPRESDSSFKSRAYGLSAGAGCTFFEKLNVAASAGYLHSAITWLGRRARGTSHSLFLVPSVSYNAQKTHLALSLIGAHNRYQLERSISWGELVLGPKAQPKSWDVALRLDVDRDFALGKGFVVQPMLTVDYLRVMEEALEETIDDDWQSIVKSKNFSFLQASLALQLRKEFFFEKGGGVIPSIKIGWLRMQPLSQDPFTFCFQVNDISTDSCSPTVHYEKSNQILTQTQLAFVHKRGVLVSLIYERLFGSPYQTQYMKLRIECDW